MNRVKWENISEQIMKEYDDEEEAALSDRMSLQNLPIVKDLDL